MPVAYPGERTWKRLALGGGRVARPEAEAQRGVLLGRRQRRGRGLLDAGQRLLQEVREGREVGLLAGERSLEARQPLLHAHRILLAALALVPSGPEGGEPAPGGGLPGGGVVRAGVGGLAGELGLAARQLEGLLLEG